MLRLDHLAVSAVSLDEGVAAIEDALGVALGPGGNHPHMSTHNRLLGLGDVYLEVIAADPAMPAPAWPRWFDLDHFAGLPRLTNWIASCADLDAEIALSPPGIGVPVDLARGDLRWRMGIPADGRLPYDGCFPALISWQGALHPTARLPDAGVRLIQLAVVHPEAVRLSSLLNGRFADPRIRFETGPQKFLSATFLTPHGERILT